MKISRFGLGVVLLIVGSLIPVVEWAWLAHAVGSAVAGSPSATGFLTWLDSGRIATLHTIVFACVLVPIASGIALMKSGGNPKSRRA